MIEEVDLGFAQKIRLQKIKRLLRNNHVRFGNLLFDSALSFERIMDAELIFVKITNSIIAYITRYV